MDTTWIGELARWIGRFFPRLMLLDCTDIGAFIKRGTRVKILKPGLHLYWPIWTTPAYRPANIQTVTLPPLALVTEDGKRVVAGGMIRYEFGRDDDSVHNALIDTEDVEAAIVDECLAVFSAHVTSQPFDKLRLARADTSRSLTGKLTRALASYGVNVLRAQLTDLSPCTTLNHVGISPRQVLENEE